MTRRFLPLLLLPALALAAPIAPTKFDPPLAPASDEAKKAIPRFRTAGKLDISVWAAEPMLAQPVALALDEKGNVYVAETFRHSSGVTDNRSHMYWLDDELACRTVEDRVAMYRKHLGKKFPDYEKDHDRVRMLRDTDGDGTADKSTVFADGFHKAEDGIGSGLLARKGDVFYACIPHLWRLRDKDGDGVADERESLSNGYGVHVAFIGHDLHGLRMGPDGKLYFTVGDRGLNVKTKEGKTLFYPDTGAVLRCWPDGSELEVVHSGLRNPQELAFDDFGNLFTVDNNSDAGDQARFVQIVEGGDSGWRLGYQYGSSMSDRGPWHAEKIWHNVHPEQPADIVPPIRHFGAGPSGFAHYPGVGLDKRYDGHFFLVDFRGNSGGSGIWSFGTKPKGAGYEMTDDHQFIWSVLATDCDFGPDSAMYLSDWVEGWNKNGKGRIYRVADPEAAKNPAVAEAKKLIGEGFDQRPVEELAKLLAHPHQTVRLESQYALAAKGDAGRDAFVTTAKSSNRLAKAHSAWGLRQSKGNTTPRGREALRGLAKDADDDVRIQAARCLDASVDGETLLGMLRDASLRVRLEAALSLAKVPQTEAAAKAAVEVLRENADKDAYLRHAGVMLLTAAPAPIVDSIAGHDASPSVRLGAVLALRRQKSAKLADYLFDADSRVATEAARAIHDELINDAMPKLAALTEKPDLNERVGYRALNANFRLGGPDHAVALAKFAARSEADPKLRVEALRMLGDWATPGRRDRVTGLTQSLPKRGADAAVAALKPSLGGIFTGPNDVRAEAAKVAGKLGIKEVGPALIGIIADKTQPGTARADALNALDSLKDARLAATVESAVVSNDPLLRNAGRAILAKTKPAEAVKLLDAVLNSDATLTERQGAFAVLAWIGDADSDAVLSHWVGQFRSGVLPAELHLDLFEAVGSKKTASALASTRIIESKRDAKDKLGKWREALAGGDAEAGRRVFLYKSEVSCLRCHKVQGTGGEVGPDITGLGAKQNREYLLEAIVNPNAQIAKGFESVTLVLNNGKAVTGVVKAQDATTITLVTPEGQQVIVRKADIDDQQAAKSAMPEDVIQKLTKRELRDLVEFLATVK